MDSFCLMAFTPKYSIISPLFCVAVIGTVAIIRLQTDSWKLSYIQEVKRHHQPAPWESNSRPTHHRTGMDTHMVPIPCTLDALILFWLLVRLSGGTCLKNKSMYEQVKSYRHPYEPSKPKKVRLLQILEQHHGQISVIMSVYELCTWLRSFADFIWAGAVRGHAKSALEPLCRLCISVMKKL